MANKRDRKNKKREDAQKYWEDKISRAKGVHKNWYEQFQVAKAREYFDGNQNEGGIPASEWITINKVYSHVKAALPVLYSVDPYFYVTVKRSYDPSFTNAIMGVQVALQQEMAKIRAMGQPPNPMVGQMMQDKMAQLQAQAKAMQDQLVMQLESKAKIRQAYLNYLKDELDLKSKARMCIQDSLFAYGVMKVHYYADMEKNPDYGSPIKGEDDNPLLDAATGKPLEEPEYIPANQRYCITRVHPDDFIWDEDAGPLEESWKWLAQRVRMTREEAMENPLYSKAALRSLEQKAQSKDDGEKERERRQKGDIASRGESGWQSRGNKKENEDDLVTVWEIYDLRNQTWTCIAEGCEVPLIDAKALPPGVDKHPYAVLRSTLRDCSPYPIPPVFPGLDAQREYNLANSRFLTHQKRFNRKYLATEGMIEPEEVAKLETGDDGTVVFGKSPGAVAPIADAPMDQQHMLLLNGLNQTLSEMLGGMFDESRGIAGSESATQAAILNQRLNMREEDHLKQVSEWVQVIARKLDMLVQTHIQRDEAVRIVGPEGENWMLVRSDDYTEITGEFQYDVNVGASLPKLPQTEKASFLAFLGLLASAPWLAGSRRLLKKWAEWNYVDDQTMLDELQGMARMALQQGLASKQGSQPNVSEDRPQSAMPGMVGGNRSLEQPGAGNIQGV